MERSSIRVVVVDDFQPWRTFICTTLQKQKELQIIGEASDGFDAVQLARQLKPDLILLDIGLPKLNGIEAARQIRQVSVHSKILFVSENRSRDIAEEVLRTGAVGYLVKSNAGSELWPAVEAVLQGKQFVSAGLVGPEPGSPAGERSADPARDHTVLRIASQNVIRHEVEFYADDSGLVEGFARNIEASLKAGNVAIVIATESHRAGILHGLRSPAVDVDSASRLGSFIQLDAAETLASFMVNDMPDPVRCEKVVSDLLRTAKFGKKPSRVAICGECAPTLLARGNAEAAIRLEHLWDQITTKWNADTLCGYLWNAFPKREQSPVFQRICAEHSAVHSA